MYTIFVGDKPIYLTTKVNKETDFKVFLLKSVDLAKIIRMLNRTDLKAVYLVGKKEEKLLKIFLKKLPNVIAGGGKVYNKKGKILFIYRNHKWDLPKGKTEGKGCQQTCQGEDRGQGHKPAQVEARSGKTEGQESGEEDTGA